MCLTDKQDRDFMQISFFMPDLNLSSLYYSYAGNSSPIEKTGFEMQKNIEMALQNHGLKLLYS